MRKALLASTIIALLAVPAAAAVTRSWPKIDNWMTIMLDGQRGEMCSTVASTASDTVINIIMQGYTTHLFVSYGKAEIVLPRTVNLSADGVQFFAAPIISHGMDALGNRFVVADLPGATYRDVVVPALIKSNFMQVDLGDQRVVVATKHFSQVVPQIIDCALATQRVGQ